MPFYGPLLALWSDDRAVVTWAEVQLPVGTSTGVSAAATAVGVAKVTLLVGKPIAATAVGVPTVVKRVGLIEAAVAHGSPAVYIAATFVKSFAGVAVGVPATSKLATFQTAAGVAAVGSAKVVKSVGKIIVGTAIGTPRLTRVIGLSQKATAVGSVSGSEGSLFLETVAAVAHGVVTVDDAETFARTQAAQAVGVPNVTVTFIPFVATSTATATGEAATSHDRSYLSRVGRWLTRN